MTEVIVDGLSQMLPALAALRLAYSLELQGFEVIKQNECYYVFEPKEVVLWNQKEQKN